MASIETKTTKAGRTVHYLVGDDGKKRQISSEKAQAIINGETEEENKMTNISNTELEMVSFIETDGSEDDADDNTVWALLPALSKLNDVSDSEPAIVGNTEYKQQCGWENPHNYTTTGSPHAREVVYTESVDKKALKKTKAAEQQQKWLSNAKISESGQYYIVLL